MANILVVEDDLTLGNLLEKVLGQNGHSILRAYSGSEAILLLKQSQFDLILLDLMLPGADGQTVLKQTKNIPVLVISAKNDIDTKVSLLMEGACDFLEKPFDLEELKARVAVQLRKNIKPAAASKPAPLSWNGLRLKERLLCYCPEETQPGNECGQAEASPKESGKQILLSFTEAVILSSFLQNPDQVISRSRLLESLEEQDRGMSYESLKVHLSRLRKKLKEISGQDWIESIWGIGYRLSYPGSSQSDGQKV